MGQRINQCIAAEIFIAACTYLLTSPSCVPLPPQMIVAGFSTRVDLSKAAEIANEVRRVVKDLKEFQQQAFLYNQRERLFNMPVTQVMM